MLAIPQPSLVLKLKEAVARQIDRKMYFINPNIEKLYADNVEITELFTCRYVH